MDVKRLPTVILTSRSAADGRSLGRFWMLYIEQKIINIFQAGICNNKRQILTASARADILLTRLQWKSKIQVRICQRVRLGEADQQCTPEAHRNSTSPLPVQVAGMGSDPMRTPKDSTPNSTCHYHMHIGHHWCALAANFNTSQERVNTFALILLG
jgi:hypothetical protein